MRSRKNKNEAIKHIIRVIRDICNRYRDKVTQSTDLADKAVKELALPTGNIYAVALMREQLRQLTRMEMRRRHNDPDELETLIEGETGENGQGDSTEPSKITIPCSAIRQGKRPTCRNRKPRLCSPPIHTQGIALARISLVASLVAFHSSVCWSWSPASLRAARAPILE
jgi:hypothetical protein